MTGRDFLNTFIQEIPSRGLDDVGVYICMKSNEYEYECQSFKIKEISNDGNNDSITIYISKVD